MFCSGCGKQVDDNAQYCPYCGTQFNGGGATFKKVENFVDSVANRVDQEVNRVFGDGNQGYRPRRLLKTNRSLIVYILLNFITCGFYEWFFIHSMAQDVNEACENDSERTPGVAMFILMRLVGLGISFVALGPVIGAALEAVQYGYTSGVTNVMSVSSSIMISIVSLIVGIYPLYWRFKLGNKLQRNGVQYNMQISENGSSVLLWDVIGILCCCLGSLYALSILIKNTNAICQAYNNKYIMSQNTMSV